MPCLSHAHHGVTETLNITLQQSKVEGKIPFIVDVGCRINTIHYIQCTAPVPIQSNAHIDIGLYEYYGKLSGVKANKPKYIIIILFSCKLMLCYFSLSETDLENYTFFYRMFS